MFIEEIIENKGELWNKVRILWLYINIGSYQVKIVYFSIGLFLVASSYRRGNLFKRLVTFFVFLSKKTQKWANNTTYTNIFSSYSYYNHQLSWMPYFTTSWWWIICGLLLLWLTASVDMTGWTMVLLLIVL